MSSPAHGSLAERIDALLPQTQCRRCGYSGCRPYAEAVASGAAPINRCPPGGDATIVELAALLGAPVEPLDPTCGAVIEFTVARIDESLCIGCTLCIDACPVDAIVETRMLEYHGEKRGDLLYTKEMLLAIGDRYEEQIAKDRADDAAYR